MDAEKLIEEAGRLCDAADPGPWELDDNVVMSGEEAVAECYLFGDARFIARARTLVPDLVTALRAEREQGKATTISLRCAEAALKEATAIVEPLKSANLAANKRIVELEQERDAARAELARLTTPRPIAEAPRDGSPVLCEVPGYGRRHLFWNEAWYLVGAPEYTYAPVSFYPSLPAEGGQR